MPKEEPAASGDAPGNNGARGTDSGSDDEDFSEFRTPGGAEGFMKGAADLFSFG